MREMRLGNTGRMVTRVGLGGMPLSISGRPNRDAAIGVVHRALELGITLIDTADVYCIDHTDIGHNERLIAEALREVDATERIVVATKGGLIRPEGAWDRDGRPEHLRAACEASLRALGVDRIDLYQLHAPDPSVPFEDSVGELARLRDEGMVAGVGLSNVTLEQLRAAQAIVPIESVQNRFNPWDRSSEETGLLAACEADGLTFLPYSPVGGGRRVHLLRGNKVLFALAKEMGYSPEELVLAWILSRSPAIAIIPGASRVSSIESSVRAEGLTLEDDALRRIEEAFRTLGE